MPNYTLPLKCCPNIGMFPGSKQEPLITSVFTWIVQEWPGQEKGKLKRKKNPERGGEDGVDVENR